jgi:MFS family permease
MHEEAVVVCASLIAVVASMRSTWSPCGISMLSTLTPYGERGRGHRYAATVVWFVVGAALGGAVLGGVIAGLAALVAQTSWSTATVAAVVVAASSVAIASDLRLGGFRLPLVPRQVNEQWVSGYRRWVYGVCFGGQIGIGVSTYVMTAGVYLMIVLGALTGRPLVGWLIGLGFGVARGLAILLGAGLSSPAAIRSFHRRFESLAPVSRAVAVAVQVGVLAVAAAGSDGLALVGLAAVAAAFGVTELRRRRDPRTYLVRGRA